MITSSCHRSLPLRRLAVPLALALAPALLGACTRQRAGAGAPVQPPGSTKAAERPSTKIRDKKGRVLEDVPSSTLAGANLINASLPVAQLAGADLSGAELRTANLTDANLRGANLSRTNLSRCILVRADLRDANLEGAALTGAVLTGAKLDGVKLAGARDHATTQWPATFDPQKHGLLRQDYTGP